MGQSEKSEHCCILYKIRDTVNFQDLIMVLQLRFRKAEFNVQICIEEFTNKMV